jgi:hypothetical protein
MKMGFRIPFLKRKFVKESSHFWEMGRDGHSRKEIRKVIKKRFKIIKELSPPLHSYHYFFILEKV